MSIITDGTGSGNRAKVDSTNRLNTRSTVTAEQGEAARNGDNYFIAGELITLTSTSESALFTVTNNEERDLFITNITAFTLESTGNTSDIPSFSLYVSTGSLTMTNGTSTAVGSLNLNFGSTKVIDLVSEKGIEGASLPAANKGVTVPVKEGVSQTFPQFMILPKGASLGITCTPPAGNTSMPAGTLLEAHLIMTDI